MSPETAFTRAEENDLYQAGYEAGRRTSKTIGASTTGFLYDGANAAQELSGTTPTANLMSGGVDEIFMRSDSTGSYSFLSDALGSTLALANGSGSIATQYTYEPFGKTATGGASTNSFQFTGRENDGTGLHFYRARYYQPQIGRFISEDPIGLAGGINLYGYAGSNPLSYTDPAGTNYTLSWGDGVVNVNAAINLYGPGATDALAAQWQQAIQNVWNKNPGYKKCKVRFNVQVTPNPSTNHWWTTPSNPNFSRYAQNYVSVPQGEVVTGVYPGTALGQWWNNAASTQIAHEAGHFFGLPDFYNQITGTPFPGFENDIMADTGTTNVTTADINGILHGRACGCQ